jgi:hypothetical protein
LASYGCNRAKSPDAVANEVAAAQDQADAKVANARKNADQDDDKAAAKVVDKAVELNGVDAKGAYDVTVARAEGDHTVSLKQCMALDGDAQRSCVDKADAAYNLAKANAKAALAAQNGQQ